MQHRHDLHGRHLPTLTTPMSDSNDATSNRRRRPSSLQVVAASLPSMEALLDACIARANELEVPDWDHAESVAAQEDAERRDADALRWNAAETQLREREAREVALRRQLDTLQGQVDEAEAHASRLRSDSTEATELRTRLADAEQRVSSAEARALDLSRALVAVERQVAEQQAPEQPAPVADDRVRIAEARAAKAIAAAHAVVAGLSISPTELAAIESGLRPVAVPPRRHPQLAIAAAFVGGIALMFAVSRLVRVDDRRVVAQPTSLAAPPVARPAPTVTPIEHVVVTPIEQAPTPPVANARTVPPVKTRQRPAVHHSATPGLVDPFGAAAPTKDTSLVDPFKETP
jgi:hypothetical protein